MPTPDLLGLTESWLALHSTCRQPMPPLDTQALRGHVGWANNVPQERNVITDP